MDKKTAQELIEKSFNNAFSEEQFTVFAKNLLNDLEDKDNTYSGNLIWDDYKEHINTYKRIGKYIDPDGEALDVLIVEVKSVTKLERARTALRNFVIKHLSKFDKDYALVAFYSKEDDGADWRFSFIKLEYRSELDEEKGKVKTKKEFTPAKRYSFLVGKYEKAHTAKNQLLPLLQNISNNPTIEELESAFSIEKVTDEFFNQYKDLYIKLYEHFENDKKVKAAIKEAGIDNARFTKKLLGQIVFLYFLQKKGWLGVAQNAKWGTGKKRFVQELYEQAKKEKLNFFKDKLQYLFYEALAKERDNVNSYYKRFDCRIPFLNGGLFEAEYNWQEANITIPENLFRNEEKNKSGDVGTGILDVFDRYNFTIKEDEPLDKEVAVDPEMLGKVFENMLDITERKSKGAFYTPREIVHYMCQESLIHYLDNALNNGTSSYQELGSDQTKLFGGSADKKGNLKIELEHTDNIRVPKKDIEAFIREGHFALENDERVANKGETKTYQYKLPESIRKNADLIDKQLSSIKICDPAIGSGAFPVGLLHELVNAMLVLKPHLGYDYLTEKLKGFGFTHRESISDSRYIYRLKRHIIQESIYGVDIDSSAIDIARLRLWLSLVVDEDDLDPIETLPNLDYKIVAGNSLIGLPDGSMKDLKVEAELEKLKEKFYDITDEKEKKALRQKINTKIRELLDSAEQFAGYKIDFDFKLFFSEVWREKGGFDVVIGNPPYGANFSDEEKNILKRLYPKIKGQPESYEYFIFQAIEYLCNKFGSLTFINPTNFIESKRAEDLRVHMLNNGLISIISNFRYNVWKDNASETLIFFFVKNRKGKTKVIHPKTPLEFAEGKQYTLLNQDNWRNNPGNRFIIRGDNSLLKRLSENSIELGSACDVSQGIIVYKTREDSAKNLYISDEPKAGWVKLLDTKSKIEKYRIFWGGRYLKYGDWLWCQRDEKYFTEPKILFIRLRNKSLKRKLIGAFDDGIYYNRDNFNNIISTTEEFPIKYVLSIFNSDVINYWYKSLFDNVNINPEQVRLIPLRDGSKLLKACVFKIIDYLSVLSENQQKISFDFFDSVLESLIYELYFPEEIKSAGKEILKHLGDLKPITDDMSEEMKLAIIQSEFERLYDPNHPVRFAIETLDSVEEVRIIKEALK
jgi:hypothetical protein